MKTQLRSWYGVGMLVLSIMASSVPAALVTDGLIIHLDAGDITGLSDGAVVTSWADSATSDTVNGTVSQSSGYGVPVYKTGILSGRPVVRFTKSNKDILASSSWSWTSADGITVFAVFTGGSDPANGAAQRLWQAGSTTGTAAQYLTADVTAKETTQSAGLRYGNGNTMITNANNPLSAGVFNISAWQMADGGAYSSAKWYMNGTSLVMNSITNPANVINLVDTGNELTIGNGRQTAGWVAADYYNGDIAEVVVYNKLLTEAQISQVTQYLKDKYYTLFTTPRSPSPDFGATEVAVDDVTLSWQGGVDPNGNSLPGLKGYYIYLGEESDMLYLQNDTLLSAEMTTYVEETLLTDTTYYWRIEEALDNGQGGTYAAGDPNNIMGTVWSFTTIISVPVITDQPDDILADVGGEAQISVGVSSMSESHYAWYKSSDNANDTPDDDTLMGTDSNVFSIRSAMLADEGYYYCKITNAGGSVTSDAVRLGIKRVVASWTLDAASFSEGVYQDSSGEGHDAEPNLVPDTASFVAGADPARTNQGLDLTVKPLAAGDSGVWDPTVFTDEMTISVWCKWAGNNGSYQGIVSKKTQAIGEAWYLEVTTENTINFAGTDITAMTTAMPAANEWVHLAVTASPVSAKHLYVNGVEKASAGTVLLSRIASNIYLGANNRSQTTGSLISTFNGVLDEVRIYNYAKDKFAVADLYYDIQQIPLCLNPNSVDLTLDIAGGGANGDEPDCVIDLMDFAMFAQHWLDCGYYPQSACQ